MFKKLELKDYVLTGLTSAVYIVVYLVVILLINMLGPIGQALSPAIGALICGPIIVFMCHEIDKTGIYTLFSLLVMLLTALMGIFYLPWFISIILSAILADIISTKFGYQKLSSQLISYSLINVGSICGSLIPIIWGFAESYREVWIITTVGIVMMVVTIISSCIGIVIGRKIGSRYFNFK